MTKYVRLSEFLEFLDADAYSNCKIKKLKIVNKFYIFRPKRYDLHLHSSHHGILPAFKNPPTVSMRNSCHRRFE